jgi:hypothetical protein
MAAPTRAITVRYEALLNDTNAERNRIYEFLALDVTAARELESWDLTLPGVPQDQSAGFFRKGTPSSSRNLCVFRFNCVR